MATKINDAKTIMELASKRYQRKKKAYEDNNDSCVKSMSRLDELKLEIWKSFETFLDTFEKIKNRPELTGKITKEENGLPKLDLEELKGGVSKFKAAVVTGMGAAAGAAAGTIGASAILSGIGLSAFCVAGFGEAAAITSSFVGVNVALYGAGAIFWPVAVIAAAATAVGAVFSSINGQKKLDEAYEVEKQVDESCLLFDKCNDYLTELTGCSNSLYSTISRINEYYTQQLSSLVELVSKKDDYKEFTSDEKQLLERVVLLVALLKKLTQVMLLIKENKESTDSVNSSKGSENDGDKEVAEINSKYVENAIDEAEKQFSLISVENNSSQEEVEIEKTEISIKSISDVDLLCDGVNKKVFFAASVDIEDKNILLKNCSISFAEGNKIEISVPYSTISFVDCVFEAGDYSKASFYAGETGTVELVNCSFNGCKFGEDGFFQIISDPSFIMKKCSFNGCMNLFLKTACIPSAKISDCSFLNHTNRVIAIESVEKKRFVMDNCRFEKFKDDGSRKSDGGFMVGTTNDNSVILSKYSSFEISNCSFKDTKMPVIMGSALKEEMVWKNCHFDGIEADSFAIDMPGGKIEVDGCDFNKVSGINLGEIGDFMNATSNIRNSTFSNSEKSYCFSGAIIENCKFKNCKAPKKDPDNIFATIAGPSHVLMIVGRAGNGGRRCLSEISNCEFEKCSADYIIIPHNPMYSREISVSINNCKFIDCKADSGNMYSLNGKAMGKEVGPLVTDDNNTEIVNGSERAITVEAERKKKFGFWG